MTDRRKYSGRILVQVLTWLRLSVNCHLEVRETGIPRSGESSYTENMSAEKYAPRRETGI